MMRWNIRSTESASAIAVCPRVYATRGRASSTGRVVAILVAAQPFASDSGDSRRIPSRVFTLDKSGEFPSCLGSPQSAYGRLWGPLDAGFLGIAQTGR